MEQIAYNFLKSLIFISVKFLADRWYFKKFVSFWSYLILFLIFFLVMIMPFPSFASEKNIFYRENVIHEADIPNLSVVRLQHLRYELMSDHHRRQYTRIMQRHYKDAERLLKEAQSKCIYLPRQDRDYIKLALSSCVAALASGEPKSVLVGALAVTVFEYFSDMYSEAWAVYDLIQESKYNFEMFEFYEDILSNPNA